LICIAREGHRGMLGTFSPATDKKLTKP
jgi:hypothetical protein